MVDMDGYEITLQSRHALSHDNPIRNHRRSHTEEGSFVAPGGLGHDGHVHEKGRKRGP